MTSTSSSCPTIIDHWHKAVWPRFLLNSTSLHRICFEGYVRYRADLIEGYVRYRADLIEGYVRYRAGDHRELLP